MASSLARSPRVRLVCAMPFLARPRSRGGSWRRAAPAIVAVAAALSAGGSAAPAPVVPPLRFGGIAADPRAPGGIRSLAAGPRAAAQPPDAAQRRWLASGLVPGTAPAQRATAARALLDLSLLT